MNGDEVNPLFEYLEIMRERYPSLSKRQFALRAGLTHNFVYKVESGVKPRPEALRKAAETWGRTDREKAKDFRQLMRRAGYEVTVDRTVTDEEWRCIERWRELPERDRAQVLRLIEREDLGEVLKTLAARRVQADYSLPSDQPEEMAVMMAGALGVFRELLALLSRMTPQERTAWLADTLTPYRREGTQGGSDESGKE